MAKDPALLWYFSDWHSGTSLMSRFLKGCYMDILHAQFNHGRLSLDEIKICLGSDFGQSWPALQKKFKQDEKGLFFNERLEQEKIKRQNFCATRSNGRAGRKKSNDISSDNHKILHTINKDEDEILNEDWKRWAKQILNEEDPDWHGRKISLEEMDIFLSVAVRNNWTMKTQQSFRISLHGFKPLNGKTNEPKTLHQLT